MERNLLPEPKYGNFLNPQTGGYIAYDIIIGEIPW